MRVSTVVLGVCIFARVIRAAELAGSVVDTTGAAMTGIVVSLECSGGLRQETVTGDEGRFVFQVADAARCAIVVRAAGFRAARVNARAGRTVRLVLELEARREEVTVNDTVTANMDTVTLDRSMLKQLPVLGNNVLAAAAELLDASAVGSGGASLVVDGMEGPMRRIPAAMIQDVRINQNPYSAEYSRPGRGRIEITTRQGAPQFHGELAFQIRDSALDARNAFAPSKPDEQRREWSGSFSGPLHGKSKTAFFASLEREVANEQILVLAQTPEGEVRLNWPAPQQETEWNVGISRPLGDGGSMSLRYEVSGESAENEGVGGFSLPETAAWSRDKEHTLRYSQRRVFSPRLLGEFQIRAGYSRDQQASRLPGVQSVVVQEAFTSGGAQVDRSTTEVEGQMSAVVSWNRGRHFVKAGVNVPDWNSQTDRDRSNRQGTWSFATLADYLSGRPFSFQQMASDTKFSLYERELGIFVQHDIKVHAQLNLGLGLRYEWQNLVRDHNNLAPRMSAAWAIDRGRRLILRGGGGIFYDQASSDAWADVLRSDPARFRQVLITNPGHPDAFADGISEEARPASVVRFSPAIRSPRVLHYSLGAEWRAGAKSAFTITYLGTRGVKMFRSRDANAPLGGLRPDPALAILRIVESDAAMKRHAIEFSWHGSATRFVDATVRYTGSRTMDNTGGLAWLPPDSRDLSREWARSNDDQKHRFQALASSKLWNLCSLGTVLSLESGRPYGITTGRDDNGDGRATDRPSGLSRNTEQGFGAVRLDFRLTREFELGKFGTETEPALELRLDAFNAINTVNFGTPIGNLRSPYFGHPVSAGAARRLQISAEFSF